MNQIKETSMYVELARVLFCEMNSIQNTEMNNNNCDKFFVEPQEWMLDQIKSFEKFDDEESTIECFK